MWRSAGARLKKMATAAEREVGKLSPLSFHFYTEGAKDPTVISEEKAPLCTRVKHPEVGGAPFINGVHGI